MSKVMNRCHNCGNEIPVEARFCNVCGSMQNPSVPPPTVPAPVQQDTPQVTPTGDKTLPGSPQPSSSQSFTQTRTIQPGIKPTSPTQTPGEFPLQAKTIANPLALPKRPTGMEKITPVAIPQQGPSAYNLNAMPTNHSPAQLVNEQNGPAHAPTMNLLNSESFVTTSKAAEHWRKSWRARQYAEAGPAEDVSRGQASVPMPLMAMQQSIARMRAIARINQQQQERSSVTFVSWITIFLMFCLIVGLGAYIIATYLPSPQYGAAHVVPPANAPQPALTIQGTTTQTFKIGQAIHLHGDHFITNDDIAFLLDAITPIKDANGNTISTHVNSQGAFYVTAPIGSDWPTGSDSIEAIDSKTNQDAFVTIQVIPTKNPVTTSPDLSLTMNDKPVKLLTFTLVTDQGNPDPQPITIKNTSQAPLKWSAAASADNSWLHINDHHTFGLLAISQTDTLLISVNIASLKSATYTGQIIFTINDNQQLTLPVQLQISDVTPEMVFSPNPIIAQIAPGNTCQPGVTLTLINLSTQVIIWAVVPYYSVKDNIRFVNTINGQPGGPPIQNGTLARSGQPSDTQVLTLQCYNVQVGHQYRVTVYANRVSWPELIIIQ